MRRPKDTIRFEDADGKLICRMTAAQRDEKLAAGEIEPLYWNDLEGPDNIRGYRQKKAYGEAKHHSAAAITFRELQASVGITNDEPGQPANAGRVAAARLKILAWREIAREQMQCARTVTPAEMAAMPQFAGL